MRELQPSDLPLSPPKGKSSFQKLTSHWGLSLIPSRLLSGSSVIFPAIAPLPPMGKHPAVVLALMSTWLNRKPKSSFLKIRKDRPEMENIVNQEVNAGESEHCYYYYY